MLKYMYITSKLKLFINCTNLNFEVPYIFIKNT